MLSRFRSYLIVKERLAQVGSNVIYGPVAGGMSQFRQLVIRTRNSLWRRVSGKKEEKLYF